MGHGEPAKAVEQGQPWVCKSAHSRGLFNGAEMLVGTPPWDVLQPHHRPLAPYQLCHHRKGPSLLGISSSAKKIEETRRPILKFLSACDSVPMVNPTAHFQTRTWRMATQPSLFPPCNPSRLSGCVYVITSREPASHHRVLPRLQGYVVLQPFQVLSQCSSPPRYTEIQFINSPYILCLVWSPTARPRYR